MTAPSTPDNALSQLRDVPAPGKLNLFLHVTGRRNDGYHLLQSVFMLIDWCDRLDFTLRPDGQLSREDVGPSLPPDDLCLRAARALREATGCPLGAHIRVTKHLPAEAGLGGGSSDAATCLLALNRLWGLGLNRTALRRIGERLGADVPFFLGGRNAWVEGVGEHLTPVSVPAARFAVVKPPSGASTPTIFSSPDLKRDTKTAIIQGFAANDKSEHPVIDFRRIAEASGNDLQPVAQVLCPEVGDCIDWLQSQGLQGRMTGSGTAVFALLPPAQHLLPGPGNWVIHECSNMDVHPLIDWCSD